VRDLLATFAVAAVLLALLGGVVFLVTILIQMPVW
jgi:hypothetical protein